MNFDWHGNLTTYLLNFRMYGPGRFDPVRVNGHGYVHHVHLCDRRKVVPPSGECGGGRRNCDSDVFERRGWPWDEYVECGIFKEESSVAQSDNPNNYAIIYKQVSSGRAVTDQGVRTVDVLV